MIAMPQTAASDFAAARFNMVESQLRPNQVTEPRLLAAMSALPREQFVPPALAGIAYLDESVPLISGRALMQPMALARLIQAAAPTPADRVLDIAPATGYSSLLLSELCAKVIAVEPDATLHKEAETNLSRLAPDRILMLAGAPVEGCKAFAPFDVIFINGSVDFLPDLLTGQLAEGGRLVCVLRRYGPAHSSHSGQARIYRKTNGNVTWTPLFDVNLPLAPGFASPSAFRF